MKPSRSSVLPLLLMLIATLALSGCGKKTWYWPFGKDAAPQTEAPADLAPTDTAMTDSGAPPVPGTTDMAKPADPSSLPMPTEPTYVKPDATGSIPASDAMRKPGMVASELEMVHFEYDKSELTPAAQQTLDKNAEWLLQHPGIQVQIEGHADERGTVEYNLALGQRRADSVREYLSKKGVDANTLHTISYGKERPLAFGDTDADHAMNRRAQFLIFTN